MCWYIYLSCLRSLLLVLPVSQTLRIFDDPHSFEGY